MHTQKAQIFCMKCDGNGVNGDHEEEARFLFVAAVFYQNIMQMVRLLDCRCVHKHTSMKFVTILCARERATLYYVRRKTNTANENARAYGAQKKNYTAKIPKQ